LKKRGLQVEQQKPIKVVFDGIVVGEYFADLLVEAKVILELKAAQAISDAHKAQLINYLKATGIEVGLILNFGPKATFKREIFTKNYPKQSA
jgi:GxxExxY protein